MFNSIENPSNDSIQKPDKEVDKLAQAFNKLSNDVSAEQTPLKNTFTPEGWFIHEAKGTETINDLPGDIFKDVSDEEKAELFKKYATKFKQEPISSDKSI